MFKKIVSNLPFSPSLVSQLGFYARRLKKEQWMRRLGLIFTVFALVIQSLAIFNPPQSANASSSSDMKRGGCWSISCYLSEYDDSDSNIGFWARKVGITREEIADMYDDDICTGDWTYSFGMTDPGYNPYSLSRGGRTIRYGEGWRAISSCASGFTGDSDHAGEFSFINDCGNLQLQEIPPTPEPPKPPTPPSASCTDTWIEPTSGIADTTNFTFHTTGTVSGGAQWNGFKFDWSGAASGSSGDQPMKDGVNAVWNTKFKTPGTYNVRGYLNSTVGQVTSSNCVATITVKEKIVPSYDLSKSVDLTTVEPDGTLTYTLVFKNTGNGTLTNAVVKDTLPENVTLSGDVTTTPADGVSGDLFGDGLKIAKVEAGKSVTIQFKVKVASYDKLLCGTTELVNTAVATTKETTTEDDTTNNSTTTIVERTEECLTKKTAYNNTQNQDATTTKANGGDSITFTLKVVNGSSEAITTDIVDSIQDTLEYADLADQGGGTLETRDGAKALVWKDVTIGGGETITRNFTVLIKNPVPSFAQGQGAPNSYDCRITNSVVISNDNNATISIPLVCPVQKTVEQVVTQLPATGAGSNILFGGIVAAIVVFFYARSRQLGKEVRLVRREFNAGTL